MTAIAPATRLGTAVADLTEETSKNLAAAIQWQAISSDLREAPIETSFVQWGQGDRPLLCLHGFDSSVFEFRRLLPQLANQHSVRAVDCLGFGFTERPEGLEISPATIRQHLWGCWQAWYQKPIVLVGASMGGAIAIDFALHHPEAVAALVLIDSAGIAPGPWIGRFLPSPLDGWAVDFLGRPDVRRRISERAYHDPQRWVTPDAETCAALHLQQPGWREGLRRFTRSGGYGSMRSRLSQLQQPTQLIWGRQDQILGTKDAAVFQQLLPQNELVWIEDCGHVPHLEQPLATAEAIATFVAGLPT
ncbi:alpha/beta fold hydrolase [Synechococcus elongatus]|uniref:Alpha/beta hydrolase n=1 Tax=Synechococcus elongatus PCC 11802 TaxID=2283154 RepID=A0AAT9JX16_SYNEL|nr:alpha/beta hydrolase [Synechococcus elongatus]QFZ91814.1 alpha/beta hydrolase [Synechococcus elongatus PCC 11802]